jgi:hypothetical protein
MPEDDLLDDVNVLATARMIPSLLKAATAWAAKSVTVLDQGPLTRDLDPAPIQLRHLWLDLRHMTFIAPPPKPPSTKKKKTSAGKATKKASKKTVKKPAAKTTKKAAWTSPRTSEPMR